MIKGAKRCVRAKQKVKRATRWWETKREQKREGNWKSWRFGDNWTWKQGTHMKLFNTFLGSTQSQCVGLDKKNSGFLTLAEHTRTVDVALSLFKHISSLCVCVCVFTVTHTRAHKHTPHVSDLTKRLSSKFSLFFFRRIPGIGLYFIYCIH